MPKLSGDLIVLFIAILVGFATRKRTHKLYHSLLPYFLLLTLMVEVYGLIYHRKGENNVPVFNFFSVIEFSFFLYFYHHVIRHPKLRKTILILEFLLPAACLFNIFFYQGFYVFHTITYTIGSGVMIALGVMYIYQLFTHSERINLLKEPSFWICIAVIFFFTSSITLIGAFNYVSLLPDILRFNLQKILKAVNIFFYLIFTISFLCSIPTRKSLSNS